MKWRDAFMHGRIKIFDESTSKTLLLRKLRREMVVKQDG